MKTYNALVIDPFLRTIRPIVMNNDGKLDQHYKIMDTDMVEMVKLVNGDTVWVDEEGLYADDQKFFYLPGYYPEPLAGIAIVLGLKISSAGNDLPYPHKSTQAELEKVVQWYDRAQLHSLYQSRTLK